MGVLTTVSEALRASTQSPDRGEGSSPESKGANWRHDCGERAPDVDGGGEGPPGCPTCGAETTFERSAASTGCAC